MKKTTKIIRLIEILGFSAFLYLFAICIFSPATAFSLHTLKLIWLPNLPLFIIFLLILIYGMQHNLKLFPALVYFTPILIVTSLLSFTNLKYASGYGISYFFLDPCIFGVMQISLAMLVALYWSLHLR